MSGHPALSSPGVRTLITRRGGWRPGGWQNGRGGCSRRSGLQGAARPSVGKRASRLCDPCDPASCCNALVSCGSDGGDVRRDALLGQHLTDFVPVLPLIPHHRGRRRQVFAHPIRTGEVTALPLLRWSRRGSPLVSQTPSSLVVMPPLGPTSQAGLPPFVEAGRRGGASSGSGESGSSGESDADNSEKIRSNTPLSDQRRKRL